MTALKSIPKSARLDFCRAGTINEPESQRGKSIEVMAYTAVVGGDTLTRWLIIRIEGLYGRTPAQPHYCKRYSGRRLASLTRELAEIESMVIWAETER